MNIPEFTAQASLYRTSNRYRSSGSEFGDLGPGASVLPAYYPGPAAQAACNNCLNSAVDDYLKCIASEGFPASLIYCTLKAWWDGGSCVVDDCCPKRCGPPDFFDLAGSGCCDKDENCVDQNDANSRHGCCPSDQRVCAGKCCAKGESCCGDTCCPPGWFCTAGVCSQFLPFGPPPPPPPPPRFCKTASDCGLGLQCCPAGAGPAGDLGVCQPVCIH
jgi:hypothetical protein